jgi:hypothetical protein
MVNNYMARYCVQTKQVSDLKIIRIASEIPASETFFILSGGCLPAGGGLADFQARDLIKSLGLNKFPDLGFFFSE